MNKGLSVNRALLHLQVRDGVVLEGNVLDAGGGHRQTYLEYLDVDRAESLIALDIRTGAEVNICGSVTNIPIKTETIDTVLCFNLLEHVHDHMAALVELRRVMKPGAVLFGWTPFAFGVHGDPYDYWRFTPDALRKLLSDAGFSPVYVAGCGSVFLAAFDMLRPYMRGWILGKALRLFGVFIALAATWLFVRLSGRVATLQAPSSCPNGIWFVAISCE